MFKLNELGKFNMSLKTYKYSQLLQALSKMRRSVRTVVAIKFILLVIDQVSAHPSRKYQVINVFLLKCDLSIRMLIVTNSCRSLHINGTLNLCWPSEVGSYITIRGQLTLDALLLTWGLMYLFFSFNYLSADKFSAN